jgi:hypothetical protein
VQQAELGSNNPAMVWRDSAILRAQNDQWCRCGHQQSLKAEQTVRLRVQKFRAVPITLFDQLVFFYVGGIINPVEPNIFERHSHR